MRADRCRPTRMFHAAARASYDVALCMYHDQALIPIKTLAFDHAVNVTLGLPFVRTSPDHGTAFDIAGTGTRRPDKPDRRAQARGAAAVAQRRPPSAMSAIDDLPPLREVIRRHGLTAKKSLGQNFLLDLNLTARIARAAGPLEDVTVVEIGPGPGGLTRALLAAGRRRVIAIERDERALAALERDRRALSGAADGRRRRCAGRRLRGLCWRGPPARVVANLPYNIATPLLIGWLTAEPWPPWYDRWSLMFQREVAERIVAAAGDQGLRPAVGADGLAHAGADLCSMSRPPLSCRRRMSPPRVVRAGAARRSAGLRRDGARARDRGGLRPAPQDAAPEPEIARRRSDRAARGRRHRADRAGRGDSHRGLRAHWRRRWSLRRRKHHG